MAPWMDQPNRKENQAAKSYCAEWPNGTLAWQQALFKQTEDSSHTHHWIKMTDLVNYSWLWVGFLLFFDKLCLLGLSLIESYWYSQHWLLLLNLTPRGVASSSLRTSRDIEAHVRAIHSATALASIMTTLCTSATLSRTIYCEGYRSSLFECSSWSLWRFSWQRHYYHAWCVTHCGTGLNLHKNCMTKGYMIQILLAADHSNAWSVHLKSTYISLQL